MPRYRFYFAIAMLVVLSQICISQVPTSEERARIIKDLSDPDASVQSVAIDSAIFFQMTEIVPLVQPTLWNEGRFYQLLRVLELLHSDQTCSTARAVADSAHGLASRSNSSSYLELRVLAATYLFKCGDFSLTSDVLAGFAATNVSAEARDERLLRAIVEHVPVFADSAKSVLKRLTREGELPVDRINALRDLVDLYGTEMFPELVNMASNDPDAGGSNRLWALEKLFELDYLQLHSFLEERLTREMGWPYRTRIADSLLNRYGTPTDFEFVKAYQSKAPEPTEKNLIGKALQAFSPPVPSAALSTSNMLDTLISYMQQCVGIGWIADANFVNELENGLANARKHLMRGDSTNCAKEIKKFQDKVNKQYQTTLDYEKKNKPRDKRFVTVEGWKFLFYNAQYILDRLPAPK